MMCSSFEMEEKPNPKHYYSLSKVSATVRRNSEPFMKNEPCDKQADTTYDSNLAHLNVQPAHTFTITDSETKTERFYQKRTTESLPHPSKLLRKKTKERASKITWSEKRNENAEFHLNQLISKHMTILGPRKERKETASLMQSEKRNENVEFHLNQMTSKQMTILGTRKERKETVSLLQSEKSNENVEFHLNQLTSKQMTILGTRKERKETVSLLQSEKRNENVEFHLNQMTSKQMTILGPSHFPQKLNEIKEFCYSEYQRPESIFLTND